MGLAGGSKVHPDGDLLTVTMAFPTCEQTLHGPSSVNQGKKSKVTVAPRGSLRMLQEVPLGVQTTVNTEQARRWVQENS